MTRKPERDHLMGSILCESAAGKCDAPASPEFSGTLAYQLKLSIPLPADGRCRLAARFRVPFSFEHER